MYDEMNEEIDKKYIEAENLFREYHKRIREIRYSLLEEIIKEVKKTDFEYDETYTLVNSGYDFKIKKCDNIEGKLFFKNSDKPSSSFTPLCTASLVQLNMILLCLSQDTLLIKKFI